MKKVLLIFSICGLIALGLLSWVYVQEKEFLHYLYQEIIVEGKALAFTRPSREIDFESGGLRLCGSVYLPRGRGPFPGIVLTHGGASLGRKLPTYLVLSKKLAQHGYVVLSFDFRGYGESEDPKVFTSAADLDFSKDVRQAMSYLTTVKQVDPSQLYLVGHSFGAGVIIPAGIDDGRVQGMVSIAPGRRGYELFWAPDAPIKHFPRSRVAADMEIPELEEVPIDYINPILQYVTIDTILEFPEHPALLLIDGALEPPEDLDFLRNLYQKITEPKAYMTIDNAKHYFGVMRDVPLEGRYHLVTYWPHIMDALVEAIDSWIQTQITQ